ncbi:14312_t:CDS:2, partial [Acaulospora colombiana]
MSSNGKRPRYEEDSDEIEESTPSSNGSLVRQQVTSVKLPRNLEPSIFGVLPTSDFTRTIGNFLFEHIEDEYVEIVKGGIVEKVRIAFLNIYSPNTQLDYRISVNSERPVEKPTGKIMHERNKDRLSYTHQLFKIDLTQVKGPEKARNIDGTMPPQDVTHELEVEFLDPRVLIEEKTKLERKQSNRYVEIIE